MTATQISIETAPRDFEGLQKAGRFNLRVLAQQLGVFETEAAKQSYMQQSNDQQAETVQKLLEVHDGKGKPNGKAAAAPAVRTPSTKNASKAAGTGKATGGEVAGNGSGAAVAGDGAGKVLKAIQDLNEKYEGIQESIDNLNDTIILLQKSCASTSTTAAYAFGLSGKLAEQVLGASMEQVLEVVLEDMPAVFAALKKIRASEEEEIEEETEEGNDEE